MSGIEEQIIKHEGYSSKAFRGPEGALLVGYGRNLETKGLTKDEALYLLRNDIAECEADLYKIFGEALYDLTCPRRWALIDMRYTLGSRGFREFKKMIRAIKNEDMDLAAWEMRDSRWYKQVGCRGTVLSDMMRGNK